MTDLSSRIENLSPARRKLLERLNAKTGRQIRTYPLSYMQRGMWFMNQLHPELPLYNMPSACKFSGPLQCEAVWEALREIVRRHESLRTVFPQRNGVAVQEVLPEIPALGEILDLTHLPEADRDSEVQRLVREYSRRPFDLAAGPLFRATLFRLGAEEHVLFTNTHHIIGDGWSEGIITREFEALYRAFSAGKPSPLPPLELQYGDYSIWQRGWMQSDAMQRQLDFWKEQLADVAGMVLPTDHKRPPMMKHKDSGIPFRIKPELCAKLSELCRSENVTLFMVFLAGFQLALARYLGIEDFTVGTPIANRTRVETEALIGCFINILVLRTDLQGDITFGELLARVKDRSLLAYENQDLPFEKLVEELVPVQKLSHTPLFQTQLILQNFGSGDLDIPGLTLSGVESGLNPTRIEITLTVNQNGEDLYAILQCDPDCYIPERMERVAEHLELILEQMVASPQSRIWNSATLPASERELMAKWNSTEEKFSGGDTFCELWMNQVSRRPKSVAVVVEDEELSNNELSYGELNARANQFACYLRRLGVGAETQVGICMERSPELYVAILGVMKAGGVYVPMDPAYPIDRLEYMAGDAGLKALVVHENTAKIALNHHSVRVNMTSEREKIALEPREDAPVNVLPENLAYIIYTSGSTGRPKGVGISHRALCNQLGWGIRAFAITPEDRILHKVISFDTSITETFQFLAAGARLVSARPRGEFDVEYLAGLIERQKVTCIDLTPSLLQALVEHSDKSMWDGVRLVNCGGEALKPELAKAFRQRSSATLLNTYGPTEATVNASGAEIDDAMENISIGRPVANTQLYVLDRHQELAPVGACGELYIGGMQLARGYVNNPKATAEKFVPNPFSTDGGDRLYRTGDLVKCCEDGQLEFIGRVDHQVKIRGFRIELGEIERTLEGHAEVKQAAVMVREDQPGMKRLVAYYVPITPDTNDFQGDALRTHLSQSLPEYMVPSAYVRMESLPLTHNGKIDLKALPVPDGDAVAARSYEPPRGETEAALAAVWGEVLKLERVSRHDNFFELGGHSLVAVRVVTRLRRALGVEVAIRDLFAHPVLSDLARSLDSALHAELPAIVPAKRSERLPLSFAQQRLWFLAQMEGASEAYNIPVALRLTGELNRTALRQALDLILLRHESLRTSFAEIDGEPVQKIAPTGESRFLLLEHDLRQHGDISAELNRLMALEEGSGFDLENGPLIRGRLVRLAEDEHALLITMHHIVSDGWSMGVLTHELSTLYGAFLRGEDDPLPLLTIQYADYAVWQRQWIEGDILAEQTAYWKKTLAGAPALLELPADHPRPLQQDYAGAFAGLALDEQLTAGLTELGRRHGTTLYMTLLAAWALLLARLSGQQDLVIGSPVANRGRAEIEDLIGFFVNTLALRIDLSGTPSVSELLGRVREQAIAAQQHQDIPFEQVVEIAQPARSLSHSPLFQVMFGWENGADSPLVLPGLEVQGLDSDSYLVSKFDLSLSLRKEGERITGGIEYATSLFERATIERYLGYFHALLQAMVADDSQAVHRLPMLGEAERQQVLYGFNDTDVEYPSGMCMHELFEEQVLKTPDAIAVVFEEQSLSYAELNRRANRLAHQMRAQGVKPDARVAICCERGFEMIVAMLAVLKAGGAYVPLDPAYPMERLRYMLQDSAPAALLTQSHLKGLFAEHDPSLPVIDLAASVENMPESNPDVASIGLTPRHLAYIIYTSGSTGAPKGVAIEHRNAVNFIAWARLSFDAEVLKRTLFSTSLNFDLAVYECFVPITVGATIRLVPNALDLLRETADVTLINTVPSAMNALVDADGVPPTVRTINLAGEPLKRALVERIFASTKAETVCNLYGPSETTTYSTWVPMRRKEGFVPHIGRPIANTQLYILDGYGQPVPMGVVGELYIGGAGVARGYLNRPDLTSERFLADPFSTDAQARMYKTGDLGRWLADGNIEYLGRNDFQVKIRGFRIELGEIEARLMSHPAVREAVVIAREDTPGDKRLVAYYTCGEGNDAPRAEQLRLHISAKLPEYMLPSAFVLLERLPLTPNGKLDRKALPAPEANGQATRGYEPPQGETETALAAIWAEVLKLEQVSRHDNFFELGGHSLLAVRLTSGVRQRFGVRIPLQVFFEHPSVAGMAGYIDRESHSGAEAEESSLVRIQSGNGTNPLFLVHAVGGTVLCYAELVRALGPEQTVYALQSPRRDGSHETPDFEQMAESYIQWIRRVQPEGPYNLGGWSLGGLLAWEIARQLTGAGQSIALLALIDTYPSAGRPMESESARELRLLSDFADSVAEIVEEGSAGSYQELARLEAGVRLTAVQNLLMLQGMVTEETKETETAKLLSMFKHNVTAMEGYAMHEAEQKVILFTASDAGNPEFLSNEWVRWTRGRVESHPASGDHYSMMKRPQVLEIARQLSRELKESQKVRQSSESPVTVA